MARWKSHIDTDKSSIAITRSDPIARVGLIAVAGLLALVACKNPAPTPTPTPTPAPAPPTGAFCKPGYALSSLLDPNQRAQVPNRPCRLHSSGVCFGQSVYEIWAAYAVQYEPNQPPLPTADSLEWLMRDSITGFEPARIPGCSDAASCRQVYGQAWDDGVFEVEYMLHDYLDPNRFAKWTAEAARLGAPIDDTVPATHSGTMQYISERLDRGLPSILVLDALGVDAMHAVVVVGTVSTEPPALVVYDSNKPGELGHLDYDPGSETWRSRGDEKERPMTILHERAGVRFDTFVDIMAWLHDQWCDPTLRCEPIAEVEYQFKATFEGNAKTLQGTNLHRFMWYPNGNTMRAITAIVSVEDSGETAKYMEHWQDTLAVVQNYTLLPLAPFPGGPKSIRTERFMSEQQWEAPINPPYAKIALICSRAPDLDTCLRHHNLEPQGDDVVAGIPCREARLGTHVASVDICIAKQCPWRGLLMPLRYRFRQESRIRSEYAVRSIQEQTAKPGTYALPGNCQPLPGGAALACDPPTATARQCETAADCPPTLNECVKATCQSGVCGNSLEPEGQLLAIQTPGNCQREICDGKGGRAHEDDDTDIYQSRPCLRVWCERGQVMQDPVARGTECGADFVCDGFGWCKARSLVFGDGEQ